jgi:CheY-like chemotaxis protein
MGSARYPRSMAASAELRVLLVEDSDADQILTAAFLKPVRCAIDIARNGRVGVELFQVGGYDLVLMDFEMPVMNGLEAVREIRRIEADTGAPTTPVLGLTAHTIANVAVKAREAGFTELLSKPIRRESLLETVARYGGRFREAEPASGQASIADDIEDLIPEYLEKRRRDVLACRVALEAEDFVALRRLGHNMKGTGSGYGFPGLTELGGKIEAAALRSDASALRDQLERFADYVEIGR